MDLRPRQKQQVETKQYAIHYFLSPRKIPREPVPDKSQHSSVVRQLHALLKPHLHGAILKASSGPNHWFLAPANKLRFIASVPHPPILFLFPGAICLFQLSLQGCSRGRVKARIWKTAEIEIILSTKYFLVPRSLQNRLYSPPS